jgi:hypothetical protein
MGDRGEPVALVVLQSPTGRPPDTELTAAELSRHLPVPSDVAAVRAALAGAGFDLGAAVGIAFSIQGPEDLFRRYFGVPLLQHDGAWTTAGGSELPLDALPERERPLVRAVVLEPPVDLLDVSS